MLQHKGAQQEAKLDAKADGSTGPSSCLHPLPSASASTAAMAHATELPWVWHLHCLKQEALSLALQTVLLCRVSTECKRPGWQAWVGRACLLLSIA